jgi:nucleotide-binding universal stress UspA family protein
MIALKNVLVATDFGEAGDAALAYGRALAGSFGSTLHVLHVVPDVLLSSYASEFSLPADPSLQSEVNAAARRHIDDRLIDTDRGGPVTTKVLRMSNAPANAIVEYAKEANIDLIVMGTHGRKAVAHLLMGSVAERVVRTATCPVLTVHHPEHEFVLPDALTAVALVL